MRSWRQRDVIAFSCLTCSFLPFFLIWVPTRWLLTFKRKKSRSLDPGLDVCHWGRMCTSRFCCPRRAPVRAQRPRGYKSSAPGPCYTLCLLSVRAAAAQHMHQSPTDLQKTKTKLHALTLIFQRSVGSESSLAAEGSWVAVKIRLN